MSDRELTRNQYDIPDEQWRRIRWAVSLAEKPFFWPILAALLVPGILACVYTDWPLVGRFVSWATSIAAAGIAVWAVYWHWLRPVYSYMRRGIELNFERGTYYVPWKIFAPVVDAVEWNYGQADAMEAGQWPKVWQGATVDVLQDPPAVAGRGETKFTLQQRKLPEDEEPRELVDDDETVIGAFYPDSRHIDIYGPYLLQLGAGGYELSHLVDEYLWPGQSEVDDLEKGRELGIRPLQWPEEKS